MTMMVDQLEVEVVQEKSRTTAPSAASDCARRRDRTSIDAGLLLELAALAPACCCCPLARRVSALEFRALRTRFKRSRRASLPVPVKAGPKRPRSCRPASHLVPFLGFVGEGCNDLALTNSKTITGFVSMCTGLVLSWPDNGRGVCTAYLGLFLS